MTAQLSRCIACDGTCRQSVMCEINGVVDESLTRPCRTCWGDGMVWIADGQMWPYRKTRAGFPR